jgi:hypothetical protein
MAHSTAGRGLLMRKSYQPVSLEHVRTYALEQRPTKVNQSEFAAVCPPNATVEQFFATLPNILKAADLRAVVDAIVGAYAAEKPVVVGIGGHVIKTGLSPLLIHAMARGLITAVAMNGGARIHDFELALIGRTSEDVSETLQTGMWGMVHQTPAMMNAAILDGARTGHGMGESLGRKLLELNAPHADLSVLATGARLGIPVTVHIAVGGDTIHMHGNAEGAALGATSFTDFRLLTAVLQDLGDGGIYLNLGSAVLLPEVFAKALNLARNLSGRAITNFTTVNMDMLQHYRPLENVVKRPTQPGGKGYTLTGHHEIMVPLLFTLVEARLASGI